MNSATKYALLVGIGVTAYFTARNALRPKDTKKEVVPSPGRAERADAAFRECNAK